MIRSLYSAVSGMLNHQRKMDITGNNIANVNTVGFKNSRAELSTSFSQVGRSATANQPVGSEVGLGAQILATTTDFSQGAFQRTDVPTDMAINGEGFFAVENIAGSESFLTRAGNFVKDQNGFLRTNEGHFLMGQMGAAVPTSPTAGYPPDRIQIPTTMPSFAAERVVNYAVDTNGSITVVGENGNSETLGYVLLHTFENNNGLQHISGNRYSYGAAAGTLQNFQPGNGGAGVVQSGALETSNVDLAEQFSSMILTQRGFDANARTITTSDEMLQTVTNLKR